LRLHFTPFTRKLNVVNLIWQVFWLTLSWLPSRPFRCIGTNSGWRNQACYLLTGYYSYGDSAGFTPDFPFNPFVSIHISICY